MSNWHWRTLDLRSWAQTWFSEQVIGLESEHLKIVKVQELEGDCELGMRKSQLKTIYDLRLKLAWSQKSDNDDEAVTGTLTALEVAHDMDEDEYQFEAASDKTGDLAMQLKQQARKQLADKIRPIFTQFPKAMVATHGNTLLKGDQSASTSGTSTPAAAAPASSTAAASSVEPVSSTQTKSAGKTINTTTVKTESPFKITAADLFELLTDPARVPMWTRNQATIKPEVGAEVSLFGGNITGKILSLQKPSQIVMSWRPPQWEAGHFGTLTMDLNQGAAETVLSLKLDGVPIGKEEETERNLDVFYVRSLKQIGSVLYPSMPDQPKPVFSGSGRKGSDNASSREKMMTMRLVALAMVVCLLGFLFSSAMR